MIDANDTVTFVVVISIVDGDDAVTNSSYNVSLTALDIEDDENDDVAVVGLPLVSARDISVNGFGVLSITEDSNNTDNEDPKTILAGNDAVVFSADVQSVNEAMDIETVVFTVDTDLTGSLVNATLLLDGVEIDTNSYSDITATTITFDDLDTLIVEEATSELQLQLNTETIGFQKVGTTVTGINVTGVALNDVEGVDSGKDGANQTLIMITSSEDTAIVPAIVTPSAVAKLGTSTSQAKLMITADFGDNTQDANNSTPTIELDTLTFSSPGGNVLATDYEIYAEGESGDTVPGVLVSGNITFDMNAFADANNGDISDDKTYFIVPTIASGDTASLTLIETGVLYDVTVIAGSTGITSNMDQELDMGTRSID
jgi:hypothetical protein